MTQGIYTITCKTTGTAYIGASNNIALRWQTHLSDLRRHAHANHLLQSAWDAYGEGDFAFSIIEEVSDSASLWEREQYYIDARGDDRYNILATSRSIVKRKRKRINASAYQSQYISMGQAQNILGVSRTKIATMIKKGELSVKINPLDHRIKYVRVDEVEAIQQLSDKLNNHPQDVEAIKKQSEAIQ